MVSVMYKQWWTTRNRMRFHSFQTILILMLGVTSLSTFLLVFKTSEEWPLWSDDGEAAPIAVDEGVRPRTLEPVPPPLPSPPLSSPPLLKTLTSVQTKNKSAISKPNLYVLTTGVRHFQAPQAFTTTTVMGQEQTATVGPTFDEGYGPRQWPEGAKRVVEGHVTVWRKIAAECSDWCFVSEDDAIWPSGLPPPLPSEGFVSFFKEAVCLEATASSSENYNRVVRTSVPGQCMPYGAVAYAMTGRFAKILLSKLPMSKPVDHFLWEQAVVQQQAFVSRRFIVQHKQGKSLRQSLLTMTAGVQSDSYQNRAPDGVKSKKSSPKIAVAIPTYNRAGYVQLCAAALNKTIDPNDVWIFDDHSTEYTAGEVQKWFRSHSVQRNAKRFKADKQARHILEWFVGTDYDWLITLDSDLIVRPDWLELLRGMLPHTQGVMSLYHSGNPNHPTLHCDPNLCEMKSLGNAGVAWSKVLAKRMLVDMTQSDGFDWGWTEWLQKQKIPQYAAKDSLVLHVGMHGTWGADSKREKSVGFPMDKLSPDVRGRAELFLKGMQ